MARTEAGILGGASAGVLEVLERFARPLGIAFQIADDLLGTLGSSEVTGKPSGSDLREGKRTLLVALGLQLAAEKGEEAAATVIADAIGDADLSDEGVETVRMALQQVGAVDAVERRIDELTTAAMAALDRAHLAEPAPAALTGLVVKATQRTY